MATISVRCPTCDCELELDAQYRGQEVECGSCHQVFVANPAKSRAPEKEDPPEERRRSSRKRSRRYADEDEDYDDDFYDRRRSRRGSEDGSGLGDASLILGILAVFTFWCPFIGIPMTLVGLILGALGLRSSRNGTAIAGLVLNIIFFIGSGVFILLWGAR